MQLSIACNLILEGVRMRTGRWIISHRRSWMMVYVLCCNAHIKSHSNCLRCMNQCSINCPSVICSPNMSFICYGETPLVNCGPRSNSFTLIKPQTANYSLFILSNLIFIFHTRCLILCFQQAGEIDNLTVSLGQSTVIVLCAGPRW